MNTENQIQNSERALFVSEVAARLRVSERTLRTWIKAQKISGFFKIGRVWRIREDDLNKFIGEKINEAENL